MLLIQLVIVLTVKVYTQERPAFIRAMLRIISAISAVVKCLSVRPSVRYDPVLYELIVESLLPSNSPIILVFCDKCSLRNSNVIAPNGSLNTGGT